MSTDTFVFTTIKDRNDLPSSIKDLKLETNYEEKVKEHLVNMSNKEENYKFASK